ncbi:hypothetical protein P153DRAFT_125259 [Dothidotthia symphoricarpi CBS 119687]|uniref:Uncharacterized protein n=1 Tax=Dothidotthia symphoricarpi CBS 119687 TaxID=1392245 RepID=A0A6A5ZZI4_9PLEO|nr:uncharacterized protein P153DRAFT_125259 [Dothidotthia symphoricarpi CBS 119687]KAF2124696.1 hypothetical protein P153DRAFT_125259 [Dothidotthia symphoricarpi CBS 119687]
MAEEEKTGSMAEDKDLDPSEFVQHIRQLGAQRDQQDLDRVRRLEEELIKGKSERMARRAERARSISPDKPATPQSVSAAASPRTVQDKAASTPTPAMSPPPLDAMHDDAEAKKPATSAAALGRSGTLSWKQRPQSGSGRRPLSMAASSRDTSEPPSPERSPSRASVAQSLDTRSPSPSSRANSGRNSAVLSNRFSSNTSLSGGDADGPAPTRSPMPTLDSQKFAPPTTAADATDGGDGAGSSRALAMSPTQGRISPERERPTTPGRPASPTKGMGGFVQSAMLKRSDSVSKRWSTQTPPVLNRQNSTLSSRGSVAGGLGTLPKMERPNSLTRDNSLESTSRPTSSSSNLTVTRDATPKDEFVKPALPHRHSRSKSVASNFSEYDHSQDDAPPTPSRRWSPNKSSWLESALNKPESPKMKPQAPPPPQPAWMTEINRIKQQRSSVDLGRGSPLHSPSLSGRSSPVKDFASGRISPMKELSSGRTSPVKELGSGRTSPIKEFQLRPASARNFEFPPKEPKEQTPKKVEEQPSKKLEDLTPKKLEKLSEPFSTPNPLISPKPSIIGKKEEVREPEKTPSRPESVLSPTSVVGEDQPSKDHLTLATEVPQTSSDEISTPTNSKPVASRFARDSPRLVPAVKPKSTTPPKKDFRAGLKSRQQPTTDTPKNENSSELQNVFGKLRRAETKNYVAPDPLKDNILRGKEALNVTGGPKPTVRRDEFRQSLIITKEAMLEKAKESGSTLGRSDSISQPAETPEAIAIREKLTRSDSTSRPPSPQKQQSTPEAIARKKSLRTSVRPVMADLVPQPAPLFAAKEPAKASKLADRFNPALASMLARGPAPLNTTKSPSNGTPTESATTPAQGEKGGPAPELQHMTKDRARGPKRRAPRAKEAAAEAEKAPEKVTTTAAVPLAQPVRVLSSSEPPKTDGPLEELPVRRLATKQSFAERPATPAKSARVASGNFGKPSTPELPRKPSMADLSRRVSGLQGSSQSPRPESIGSPRASPVISKRSSSIELSRRISGLHGSPQSPRQPPVISKRSSSIELSRRVSGLQGPQPELVGSPRMSSPGIPRKPSMIELSRRVSGLSGPPQSPRPESIGSPKLSSPEISRKPASLVSDRKSSGAQFTPQRSSLSSQSSSPSSVVNIISKPSSPSVLNMKPSSPSPAALSMFQPKPTIAPKPAPPSPSVVSSRFSRPLPTLPSKPSIELPKLTAPTDMPPSDTETSPTTSTISVKSASSMWGRQPSPAPKGKFPIKLPTRADERAAMQDAGLIRSPQPEALETKPLPPKPLEHKPKPAGLGFMGGLGSLVAARSRESSPQLTKDLPASPPPSAGRPQSESSKAPPAPEKPTGMFAEFFDDAPVTEGQLADNIDTEHILKSPPLDLGPGGKIRTVRKEMLKVTVDGRLSPVHVQEEHVLFRECMYLCTHVYGDSKGARHTDVYLWAGNGVAESTLEDAQTFAKNHARHQQGRLLVVRQGHETPNFFEALGGILMTRRGSKPESTEFMLCGRRHLGHLAFDEVDYSLKSLCSAFPYLISTSTGKVFLWKGRGCSAEELSGARLMGMDLAPTGDFVEVDEGSEPAALLNVFPPSSVAGKAPVIPRSADHWRYKANSDRYRVRLFKLEQQQETLGWGQTSLQVSSSFFGRLRRPSWGPALSPTSTGPHAELGPQTPLTPKTPRSPVTTKVVEIMPFCQRDLEPEHVYVLDAFFEMYIIVGSLSRSQAQAFSTALLFAQEYGMLAVSEEDRPFMPFTNVVLEGVPRDMKAIFRHWEDALIPAAGLMSGKLGRGKSLRIVGLEKAIEATRR